jgi:hypothetical protein
LRAGRRDHMAKQSQVCFLVPASPAIPTAAEQQHNDDND